ncbi:hypothetical protein MW290_19010 [Aquincola tertiaricarbonis]|uniref:Uncharacterized protein n=1 Tax=Aquincola tertiaricarbonis TaxID=391953 RepID=A0ABY4SJ90_AQUTE|nr:hypothetical protein [Aquincola tertiaricarbonis]URI11061.1 hypothetical protein MW290_19010 [Aquincola tertiaricarbonis]
MGLREPGSLEELAGLAEAWLDRLSGGSKLLQVVMLLVLSPVLVAVATIVVLLLNLVMAGEVLAGLCTKAWRGLRPKRGEGNQAGLPEPSLQRDDAPNG